MVWTQRLVSSLSLVAKRQSGEIKKTTELLKFGLFDFLGSLGILPHDFLSNDRFSLRLFLTLLRKILLELTLTVNRSQEQQKHEETKDRNIPILINKMRTMTFARNSFIIIITW